MNSHGDSAETAKAKLRIASILLESALKKVRLEKEAQHKQTVADEPVVVKSKGEL